MALAAGLVTSQAQSNVYSANVVGYVNVALTNASGYTMVANQMDLDGTGTNNSIYTSVGTNLPAGTQILCWNGTTFSSSKLSGTGKWSLNNQVVSNAMQPGAGFFVNCPASTNVTFVGNVLQGTNTYPIVAGYQVVSPNVPITGTISTNFGYIPTLNDQALIWNGTTYTSHKFNGTAWSAGQPTFQIGQALFLNAAAATNWVQTFTVQ